jgi:hypothetical protein
MAIKKVWHKPEVIIIDTDNVNGGGPQPSFSEGAALHIVNNNLHISFTVGLNTFNSYVS